MLWSFLVEKNICYIALSDSSYPRKLLFHYLQDLRKELDNFGETALIQTTSKPYSFVRFSKIIGRIRKQYMDTRTQANLSKLNASRKQELDVVTEHLNDFMQRRQLSGTCSWLFQEIKKTFFFFKRFSFVIFLCKQHQKYRLWIVECLFQPFGAHDIFRYMKKNSHAWFVK